ncbi:MAG: hypothetical protein JNM28_01130 [Armatimonadetes bacterium]|nr:hypothetical protein [Armatimonadota bacterium]MBS1711089.1 hypothetical protein [Armatimonadota bacterium]MBX3108761.1 hypothetical protein [Fimbriimonadaceae bacterium]
MNIKPALAFLALLATAVASAQLSYHGAMNDRLTIGGTAVGNYPLFIDSNFGTPVATFTSDGIDSMQVTPSANVGAFDSRNVYYSFSTDNTPVRFNSLEATFDGKFVYGGGAGTDSLDASLYGAVLLYQFEDANNNNTYEFGETSFLALSTGAVQLAHLTGNGLQVYNHTIATTPNYILGANSHWFVLLQSFVQASGSVGASSPAVVLTNEYNKNTWDGNTVTINHEAVPEPATLALALPALAFLKRRKKS